MNFSPLAAAGRSAQVRFMASIRACTSDDIATMLTIINEAAQAYKGVIPADRWHEPYMPEQELRDEIDQRVRFFGYWLDDRLVGVMGLQEVKDITLVRHAYVLSAQQGHGIGRALLDHICRLTARPILIGTWRAATWAIRFYERNGFTLTTDEEKNRLLQQYWNVPARQVEESVVLANWRDGKTD
jgi:GNAT superfamily N-acetyltransferase